MKKFSELGIKTALQSFTGDKIKINRILNREITVHAYRVEKSKFKDDSKCLYLQISIESVKHVVFTGSIVLTELIERVPKDDFPFTTTIVKDNDRFEFT